MKPTLLIVDDFASVRLYHVTFLERHGYRCLEAGGGEAALALLAHESVDLIILDLMMPEMDGAALLARVRAQPHGGAIPVLVITSEQIRLEDRHLASDPWVTVLNKPVLPSLLLQNVRRCLDQAPAAVPSP